MPEATLSHGALMDGVYRSQRHIYDATRRYFLLGRDQLLDGLAVPANGTVLEMGCGTGRNLIAAARRYPAARLFGIDISDEMLKTADAKVALKGLRQRIHLAQADATRLSPDKLFGVAKFDRVFFSYTLSMIPDWQAAVDQALACVAEGGQLHIVDFGQSAGLPGLFKRGLFAWLGMFHVSPRQHLVEYVTAAAKAKGLAASFEPKFRDYAWLVKVKA